MPNLDLSQNLLSTETSYQASDWGSVGGSASLDLKADAELKRGINLGLGVSALAQLDASFRKFVAADAQAHAEASAGITAQIQVPLDIFKEAGGAIRLEAAAQAAVGIEARLGLSIGDFLALAEKDPHMQGVPLKLLRIFLEELDIQGGIKVKAAFSAMAYAKLAMTGRLIGDNAGFTVEGEYGMGLEGGAGFRYFANLGFTDPRRLIRRTVDVLVDELITELEPQLPDDQSRSLLRELRVPAKMVFRSSFELGLKLAENVDSFNLNTGVELAQHVLVVLIEEAQRFILQLLIELATDSFRWALTELGTDEAVWDAASDQRETLATLLENMPPDAFDATEEDNLIYWGNVINGCINLASALGGSALISQAWVEPVAVIWSATQLLFESAKRVSSASARVSMIGVGNAGIDASFPSTTAVTIEAPAIIRDFINNELERNATDTLNLNHLVDFLIRDVFMEALREQFPEFAPFMNIIGGQNDVGTVAAARSLFSDVGAFAPAADGTPDPQAALRAFSDALKAYLKARIGKELVPVLHQAIDNDPDLKLYVDEVFFSTLDFTINVIFEQLLGWSAGNVTYKTALREVCSGIVMRLVGRSLVVTADILSTAALAQTSDIFKDVANHVDDNEGIADQLSSLVNLEREMMAEIMEETLLIAADVFGPLPDSTRRHIRNLLYEMIETIPPGTDATFLDQLADDFFIPNFDTVQALAGELGTIILKNMEAFLTRVLQRIAEIILEEIGEIIDDIEEQIEAWVNEIEQLAADIQQKLLELAQEIIDITNEIADYMHNTSEMVVTLLGQLNSSTARSEMRQEVRTFVLEKATEALNLLPGYTLLPGQSRKIVRKSLSTAIGSLLNNAIFDDFMAAVGVAAGEADTFLTELHTIDPTSNLTQQIMDRLLDRVEDEIWDQFGGKNPKISVAFHVYGSYTPPKVMGYQPPDVTVDIDFDLGTVNIPLSQLKTIARQVIANLANLEDLARDLAQALQDLVLATLQLEEFKTEETNLLTTQTSTQQQLAETLIQQLDVTIQEPAAAANYDYPVPLTIFCTNATRSFLGLEENEQQRVFVWLNQVELPLDTFAVEENLVPIMTFISVQSSLATAAEIQGTQTGQQTVMMSPIAVATLAKQSIPIVTPHKESLPLTTKNVEPRFVPQSTHYSQKQLYRPGQAGNNRGRNINNHPTIREDVAVSIPTRHVRGTKTQSTSDNRVGLTLRLQLPLTMLKEGVNTLSVAILNGRGERIERTIVFLVTAPQIEAEDDVLHLPRRLAWREATNKRPIVIDSSDWRQMKEARPQTAVVSFWLPSKKERRRVRKAQRKQKRKQLKKGVKMVKRLKDDVVNGRLRKQIVRTPLRQNELTEKHRHPTRDKSMPKRRHKSRNNNPDKGDHTS